MDNQISRYVKLSELVNMYIDESMQTSKEFRRLWALAFRGLTDLGLDVTWNPREVLLNVNNNLTVTLPDDYIDYVRVGMINASGEIATLSVNEQLTTYADTDPNRVTKTASQLGVDLPINFLQYPYGDGYTGDSGYEHFFGAGSGLIQPGQCKVDSENKVIVLDPNFAFGQIVLQYLSSPIMDDDYAMDFKAQEALIAWLRWKDIQSLPSTRLVNISEKTLRQREYNAQKKLARKRIKPFRLATAEQYFREGQRLSVKG
jgi:hypothetical protein